MDTESCAQEQGKSPWPSVAIRAKKRKGMNDEKGDLEDCDSDYRQHPDGNRHLAWREGAVWAIKKEGHRTNIGSGRVPFRRYRRALVSRLCS